jgi:phosphomannomutase
MSPSLNAVVKTYDIRGLVGTELNVEMVEAVAAGFVDELELAGKPVVVGHDMRDSSPAFAEAFAKGATARGANVVSLGLCSTDQSYFASGTLNAASAMFTASHNPAAYNGIKLSRAGARGISLDTGLAAIRDRANVYLDTGIPAVAQTGSVSDYDSLVDYSKYLRTLVDLASIRPLKVVVDAGNGMGGFTVPAVLGEAAGLAKLPIEIVPMYFELDGNFPNHEANPLDPKNLVDLQKAVVEHGADIGLAFDGDADRCFVIDENGRAVTPSAVAAIVAEREIAREKATNPGEPITVLHNLLTSRACIETIEAAGARAVRTRVGHSLIKDQMAAENAIFGGEHSAHYYFRAFWGADNGMLAALHVLSALGQQSKPISEFASKYDPYFASGEINHRVDDAKSIIASVEAAYEDIATTDRLDGVTFFSKDTDDWWWFNLRTSNTEPLLRFNCEAKRAEKVAEITAGVEAFIKS